MQILRSCHSLDSYIHELKLDDIMDLSQIRPAVCVFRDGELLTGPHIVQKYLFFVVSGKVQIYGVDVEGRKIPVNLVGRGSVIGDVEFCRSGNSNLISEAVHDVTCIGIPVQPYRKDLMEDNRFLRFLLKSISSKVYMTGWEENPVVSVEERLLHYLETECEDCRMEGVEHAALRLRCSRRQLQRVLRELCGQGKIMKIKKGSYRLAD